MENREKIREVKFGMDDECNITELIIREESAEDFLNAWMQDRTNVPPGLFYFVDKYGLYVAIDNKTGSGHMRAFISRAICRDWLETAEFRYRRSQRENHESAFGSDSWNSPNTILADTEDLRKICIEHGWLNASSIEDMTKIMMANSCGWPIDHLATMIWMGSDYRKDLDEPIDFAKAGEQRKEILTVLTQHHDRMAYNNVACARIEELEEAGTDISALNHEEQTYKEIADPDEHILLEDEAAPKFIEETFSGQLKRGPKR